MKKTAHDKNEKSSFGDTNKTNKSTIEITDYPELTITSSGKKPLNTHINLKYLLDTLGITVRWNIMSKVREITAPNFIFFQDEEENSALNYITYLATINHMPITKIDDHLNFLAWDNHYHPIVECITSKPWDKIERLNQFINCLKTTNDALSHILVRRWMLSAIACAFSKEGEATQGVLVLLGEQNIGKTYWVKSLDPTDSNAVKEAALIDPTNKDSIITLLRYWIVELGELDATFRKSDIARIKGYITSQIDEVRLPYARKNSRYVRRTAFVATVNETNFLIDNTGNRRWWTITVERIDSIQGIDMQQVWAEVYHLWRNGEEAKLTIPELKLLNESNAEHEQIDPFEEKVLDYFDWSPNWQHHNTLTMNASEVLKNIGYDKPSKADSTRMGKILTKLTKVKAPRRYHTLPRIRTSRN